MSPHRIMTLVACAGFQKPYLKMLRKVKLHARRCPRGLARRRTAAGSGGRASSSQDCAPSASALYGLCSRLPLTRTASVSTRVEKTKKDCGKEHAPLLTPRWCQWKQIEGTIYPKPCWDFLPPFPVPNAHIPLPRSFLCNLKKR